MKKDEKKASIFVFCFWILLFFAVFSIFNIIKFNFYNADVKYSHSVLEEASINFTFKQKIKLGSSFMVCFNDVCKNPESDSFLNSYYLKFNKDFFNSDFYSKKLSNISFVFDKNDEKLIENNLNDIYLYVGNRAFNYHKKDIKNFKKKTIKIKKDDSKKESEFAAIEIPNDFKTNYKGKLNHFITLFLNLFYNPLMFLIPYFWLFIAFCIYAFKKDEISFGFFTDFFNKKKTYYSIFGLIIFMTVLTRFNLLTYNPLWFDELYTKIIAIENFKSCFQDPGNPPLFFLLEFFVSKINSSDFALKLVPCFLGITLIVLIYLLFKNINKKLALFASFFALINTIFIYHSKEIRSSILCACLIVFSIYALFEYLKNGKNKNFVLFLISQILLINTHYYLAILAFCNFVYGLAGIFDNKEIRNKKNIIKFTIGNIFCALSFFPYLLISYKSALGKEFNSWIGSFDKLKFLYSINEYFINKYIFLFLAFIVLINLILIYLPKDKLKLKIKTNPNLENLYIYLIYLITLLLIIISLISILIKPIFHKRLLLSIYPLIFLIETVSIASVLEFKKLEKLPLILKGFYSTTLFFICMFITYPMPLVKICKVDDYMNFILNDASKYISKGYEVHGFLIDHKEVLTKYPKVEKLDINWHIIKGNKGEYITKIKKEDFINPNNKNQKAVLYLNSIGVDFEKALLYNPNAYIIYTNSVANAKIIYDN